MATPVNGRVTVFKLDQGGSIEIAEHHAALIESCARQTNASKVALIKFVRREHEIGLKDAKDIVDWYFANKDPFKQYKVDGAYL